MIRAKIITYDAVEAHRGRVVRDYPIYEVLSPTPVEWHGDIYAVIRTDWREDGFTQLFVTAEGIEFPAGEAIAG